MMQKKTLVWVLPLVFLSFSCPPGFTAERLIGVQSARLMSRSMPWIAQETGIFRKYNLWSGIRNFLDEMEKSGLFEKLWANKN